MWVFVLLASRLVAHVCMDSNTIEDKEKNGFPTIVTTSSKDGLIRKIRNADADYDDFDNDDYMTQIDRSKIPKKDPNIISINANYSYSYDEMTKTQKTLELLEGIVLNSYSSVHDLFSDSGVAKDNSSSKALYDTTIGTLDNTTSRESTENVQTTTLPTTSEIPITAPTFKVETQSYRKPTTPSLAQRVGETLKKYEGFPIGFRPSSKIVSLYMRVKAKVDNEKQRMYAIEDNMPVSNIDREEYADQKIHDYLLELKRKLKSVISALIIRPVPVYAYKIRPKSATKKAKQPIQTEKFTKSRTINQIGLQGYYGVVRELYEIIKTKMKTRPKRQVLRHLKRLFEKHNYSENEKLDNIMNTLEYIVINAKANKNEEISKQIPKNTMKKIEELSKSLNDSSAYDLRKNNTSENNVNDTLKQKQARENVQNFIQYYSQNAGEMKRRKRDLSQTNMMQFLIMMMEYIMQQEKIKDAPKFFPSSGSEKNAHKILEPVAFYTNTSENYHELKNETEAILNKDTLSSIPSQRIKKFQPASTTVKSIDDDQSKSSSESKEDSLDEKYIDVKQNFNEISNIWVNTQNQTESSKSIEFIEDLKSNEIKNSNINISKIELIDTEIQKIFNETNYALTQHEKINLRNNLKDIWDKFKILNQLTSNMVNDTMKHNVANAKYVPKNETQASIESLELQKDNGNNFASQSFMSKFKGILKSELTKENQNEKTPLHLFKENWVDDFIEQNNENNALYLDKGSFEKICESSKQVFLPFLKDKSKVKSEKEIANDIDNSKSENSSNNTEKNPISSEEHTEDSREDSADYLK